VFVAPPAYATIAFALFFLAWRVVHEGVAPHVWKSRYCSMCEYDLEGLLPAFEPIICPECGTRLHPEALKPVGFAHWIRERVRRLQEFLER
jgi:hypothetical protein